jgi:hypothetical protein
MGKCRCHDQNGDTGSCSSLLIKQTIDVWSLRKAVFPFDLYIPLLCGLEYTDRYEPKHKKKCKTKDFSKVVEQMMTSEDEIIRRLLESEYTDVLPPQHLKAGIMGMIELIITLKELALLYTIVPLDLLSQSKPKGDEL